MGDITVLIARANESDRAAVDAIFDQIYPELRRIAHARLTRHVRDTMLDTTVLVHECYLKFVQAERTPSTVDLPMEFLSTHRRC